MAEMLAQGLAMAGVAMVSVGLWTLRVASTARGRRVAGAVTAGVEAVVFAAAFSSLMANLDAVERVAGYALGVAAGTFVGMALDDRLALGQSVVRVVTRGADLALVDALRQRGWPATAMSGDGLRGEVTILFVTVEDSRLRRVVSDLEDLAPDAFWTVERLRSAHHVALPEGCVQVRGGAAVRTAPRA